MSIIPHIAAPALLAAALSLVAGCAGLPPDRGFAHSQALVAARGGPEAPVPAAEGTADINAWLATPLTVNTAQRIAFVRNPLLLEHYARLGLAQADIYEAARIANPLVSLSRLDGSTGGTQIALGLAQNVADLLRLSPRRRLAGAALTRVQSEAAAALLGLAADVDAAWHSYAGAQARAALREQIARGATLSAELASRFFAAGNIDARALARAQADATMAAMDAERGRLLAREARIALQRLLGLGADEDGWTVSAPLRLPVAAEEELAALRTLAAHGRLDLLAARQAVALGEDALGVAHSYRYLNELQLGAEIEQQTDDSHVVGPTLAFSLPLFNSGAGRIARALAELDQQRAAARALALAVDADVALAHARVASQRALVTQFRDALLPQREAVLARTGEWQNWMLVDQFELLAARRDAWLAYDGYLVALTDYWVARAGLTRAVGARLPHTPADDEATPASVSAPVLPGTSIPSPAPSTPPHAHHGDHTP